MNSGVLTRGSAILAGEPIDAVESTLNAVLADTGATDGLYVRNAEIPVYGAGAIFNDSEASRSHGRDERVSVKRFYEALEFWNRMMRRLSR